MVVEKFDFSKLFVGDCYHGYLSKFWQYGFDTSQVHIGILTAWTVSDIYRELKHCESVTGQLFSEVGCSFALLLGICRKVEEYEYPHNAVLAESY